MDFWLPAGTEWVDRVPQATEFSLALAIYYDGGAKALSRAMAIREKLAGAMPSPLHASITLGKPDKKYNCVSVFHYALETIVNRLTLAEPDMAAKKLQEAAFVFTQTIVPILKKKNSVITAKV